MPAIVLSTLNARYAHASLGLRYLRANLGEYRDEARIVEVTIKQDPLKIARDLLAVQPRLIGLGIYIWNTRQSLEVVRHLRRLSPETLIVVGGPEIGYETEGQELFNEVDHVFQGEADFTFRDFVKCWMETGERPRTKIIAPALPEIKQLMFPYAEFTDDDIKNRIVYVEASRGCPYKCEYCLSALDISVRNFDLEPFLNEMQTLLDRGVRQFKFVDRTFNLAPKISTRILQFFLDRVALGLFLHFEMVPDRLPDELKVLIEKFPAGSLQFEIGIQTWNPQVAHNVSRRQNFERIVENLRYLRAHTHVHTHADLIVGLPGESFASFKAGFDTLYNLEPDEIQVGLLKRLKGTPIVRHDVKFNMVYGKEPPFQILETRDLTGEDVRQLKIFAEFYNAVANSGRFPHLKELVCQHGLSAFDFFFDLSQSLQQAFGRTHSIHLRDLESEVVRYLESQNWGASYGAVHVEAAHAVGGLNSNATSPSPSKSVPYRQAQHIAAHASAVEGPPHLETPLVRMATVD